MLLKTLHSISVKKFTQVNVSKNRDDNFIQIQINFTKFNKKRANCGDTSAKVSCHCKEVSVYDGSRRYFIWDVHEKALSHPARSTSKRLLSGAQRCIIVTENRSLASSKSPSRFQISRAGTLQDTFSRGPTGNSHRCSHRRTDLTENPRIARSLFFLTILLKKAYGNRIVFVSWTFVPALYRYPFLFLCIFFKCVSHSRIWSRIKILK